MSKLDDLRRTAGATARESAAPMPSIAGAGALHGGTPDRYRGVSRDKEANLIPLDRIIPDPDQPRKEFDAGELERLAASMKERGQLQPILVRWEEDRGVYAIIAGERRWRAADLAGLATMRAIVADRPYTAGELFEVQLIENALREDLKPIEQANAYRRLMETRGWSLRDVARELNVAHSSVARALELLDLPPRVQEAVDAGELGPTLAIEVGKIGDPAVQEQVAAAAVAEGMTRSEVTELVRAVKSRRPSPASRPEPFSLEVEPGVTVTVRWRRPSDLTAAQALRKAARLAQERAVG